MKQKILIVSHCYLNEAVKLKNRSDAERIEERLVKRSFIREMITNDIEFIQLPCPEFIIYGSRRWGHAASQFDTPFFRCEARNMLKPVLMQIQEYYINPERFELMGILGINGSPSCGIDYTYDGDWGGEFTDRDCLNNILGTIHCAYKPGIFVQVLKEMLAEYQISLPFYSLENLTAVKELILKEEE